MAMTVRELARLMELNKRKAELVFQKSVLGSELDRDIARVASSAAELGLSAFQVAHMPA